MDFATFNYMTDDGQKVNVALAVLETRHKETGHDLSVSVDVDGTRRLATDTHYAVIDQFGLGEYLMYAVAHCLREHLDEWMPWQMIAPSFLPEDRIVLMREVPIYRSNQATRHIRELDDVDAFWWLSHPTDPGHDGDPKWAGYSVLKHLFEAGKKALDEMALNMSAADMKRLINSKD